MEKEAGITDDFRAWWDIERIWSKKPNEKPTTLRELLKLSGNRYYDSDKLVNSEYGDELIKIRKPFFLSEDQMSKEVVEYWAQRGLRKELIDGPEEWNKWAIFTLFLHLRKRIRTENIH